MNRIVIAAAALAAVALVGPAHALDLKIQGSKTKAEAAGGAQSSSGVVGGSALIGVTGVTANNNSQAVGSVQAKNTGNASTVTQGYATNSTSTMASGSLGLAGSAGTANGAAESIGMGMAKQTSIKVKLHP